MSGSRTEDINAPVTVWAEDPAIPGFLRRCAETPAVRRLRDVGMNCGCEYTSFARFRGLAPYSRFDHSMGVALIVWRFTRDPAQSVAGLLHDIATPVFAHVVDFMNGDYLTQESTEAGTEEIIRRSPELGRCLRDLGLTVADVSDYHRYPIADNDAPRLSADRLEYTLGNAVRYGFCTEEQARRFFEDLTVGTDGEGRDELVFRDRETAEAFAMTALRCSAVYVSDEDRYAMQILSELLRYALDIGVLTPRDLHTTEPEVIAALLRDGRTAARWRDFRSMARIRRADSPGPDGEWRRVRAKKRYIDPSVTGMGRVSRLCPAYGEKLAGFLGESQDVWLCADR
ncbi:MAG: HD domain-containing protein [Clostridia bacterium]|nr:HD domain-containing protein [Clostridia bacterium]